MKKTIVKLLLILAALFISIGSTIAYLTDTDGDINVMTLGRVEIDLIEQERRDDGSLTDYQDNHPILPGVYQNDPPTDANGYWQDVHNAVDKIVSVKNTGNTSAYVRIWFAFEVTADDNFFDEKLHLNKTESDDWYWEFLRDADGSYTFLEQNGARYVMAVATYTRELPSNESTSVSLRQVLLDASVTNEDLIDLGEKYSIFVVAQAVQAQGFNEVAMMRTYSDTALSNAITALNAGFGVPSVETNPFDGMSENTEDSDNTETPEVAIPVSPIDDFMWQKTENGEGIIIAKYIGNDTQVRIPDTFEGLPVLEIGQNAFDEHRSITRIIIPSSVEIIRNHAFVLCTSLTSVNIPFGTTIIEHYAFLGCQALKNITIPESVTSIEEYAFAYCSTLQSIGIPESVTSIGYKAFSGLSSTTSINVADHNPQYSSIDGIMFNKDQSVLLQCPGGMTGAYSIPQGVKSIGAGAFSSCGNLTNIFIPDTVKSIGAHAFYSCSNLESVNIPDCITSISDYTFSGCGNLSSIVIPNAVVSIGAGAFSGCDNLTSIVVPDTVASIGAGAFSGCSNLESVNIPDSVTSISDELLSDCSSLTSINIPSTVTSIGARAFFHCSSLASIDMPNTVTTIEIQTFEGCKALTNVTIPSSVTSIGGSAFSDCDNLTSIVIPDTVTSIGDYAFSHCDNLTSIVVPDTVTSIGDYAFNNCKKLAVKVYPDSYAHKWCKDSKTPYCLLCEDGTAIPFEWTSDGKCITITKYIGADSNVVIPDTINNLPVTFIREFAFENCNSMINVSIPNTVTRIDNMAFVGCSKLENISIPASVVSVGEFSFHFCGNLTSIHVADNNPKYSSINGILFSKDKSVLVFYPSGIKGACTIPSTVTFIDNYAFYMCNNVTRITVPSSVTSIGSFAFAGCQKLTDIILPDSVTKIGDNAIDSSKLVIASVRLNSYAHTWCKANNVSVQVIDENGEPITFLWKKDGESITITGYLGTDTDVVIPATIDGLPVTSIAKGAFSNCTKLTSITIPDSVTSISYVAFDRCTSLTHVNIPSSVTSISSDAFKGCTSLTGIYVAEKNTQYSSVNGILLNKDKTMLVSYPGGLREANAIPSSVTNIAEWAFSSCTNLTSITLPDGVVTIGDYAFMNCSSLTSITIPNSVTSIGNGAFNGSTLVVAAVHLNSYALSWCEANSVAFIPLDANGKPIPFTWTDDGDSITITRYLGTDTDVVIPATIDGLPVTDMGKGAFASCTTLTSVTIPDSMTSIGDAVFYGCTSLTSITIPDSVTSIDICAFEHCTSLTSITLPDRLTSIGSWAFSSCSSLTSITIPDSVTSIGNGAFNSCTSLTSIHVGVNNSYYTAVEGVLFDNNRSTLHTYPAGKSGVYSIPNSVTSINSSAFYGCTSLTSITIPNSVTSISAYAFNGCTSLTSITIPNSVTSINSRTFHGCTSLASVIIPDSVTSIGDGAFSDCTSLTSITLPDRLTSIDNSAFYGCSGLTNITIPDSVTSIGYLAFQNCSALRNITIPDSVNSIGVQAFYNCVSLTSVILPDNVISIGDLAFSSCSSLTSITIPDSVTSIGHHAFDKDKLTVYGSTDYVKNWCAQYGVNYKPLS